MHTCLKHEVLIFEQLDDHGRLYLGWVRPRYLLSLLPYLTWDLHAFDFPTMQNGYIIRSRLQTLASMGPGRGHVHMRGVPSVGNWRPCGHLKGVIDTPPQPNGALLEGEPSFPIL